MPIHRCPSCQLAFTDAEWTGLEKCTGCAHPLLAHSSPLSPLADPAGAETRGSVEVGSVRVIWGLLGTVILALTCILFLSLPQTPQEKPSFAEEFEWVEQRLKKIDIRVQAAQSSQSADSKELQTRLDNLEAKLAGLFAQGTLPAVELKSQSQQLSRLETKLEDLAQRSFSPPAPPGPLDIRVLGKEWGDAEPDNVQAVCVSAAKELWAFFPSRRLEPITVANSPKGPMAVFGRGPDGERRVLLDIKGKLWARCAYQFSHEFCHLLCNHREAKNPNLWFEESLCEAASLFALRRMAKTWKIKPPYPNWKSYSDALDDYASVTAREVAPLEKLTLAEWFAKNEPTLKTNGTDRPLNRVVALALLKLLEKDPHHWQAVGYLNQWGANEANLSFTSYLSDWFQRVPALHKPFVKEVAELFKLDVK